MSIVATVKVGEGLVLAADSASSLQVLAGGQMQVAKVYNNATKLKQVKDYPIGLATWGIGNFGARSVISLIEEFEETQLQPTEGRRRTRDNKAVNVRELAEAIMGFLLEAYKQNLPAPVASQPGSWASAGVIIGGYSSDGFFPEQFVFAVPEGILKDARPNRPDGKPDFGANWFGQTDAIVRLHYGRDDRVPQLLERLGVDKQVVEKFKQLTQTELQYPVVFDGMPLRDAIDYADYLVSVVVGRFKHVIGAPTCGGPIDLAAISRGEGFTWVRRKDLRGGQEGREI